MSREMPEGWRAVSLSDVADLSLGQSPNSSETNEQGIGLPFFQGNGEFGERYPIPRRWALNGPRLAEEGDILISVRAPVGELNVAPFRCVIGRGLGAIRARKVDTSFLWHALHFSAPQLHSVSQGSTFDAINRGDLSKLTLPLPPLQEQRRIAEILSSVDEAIAATRAVIEQTRKVRSEILSTSFPEHRPVGRSTTDDTFKGWSVEPASSICESIIDCKNRTPPVTENGYAVVRTPNVRNGRFRYDGLQFTDKQSFQEWTAKGVPRAGDILFTREAPYGEVCMAPAMAFCLGQRMMFMRPDTSRVSSDFLLYALQSGSVKQEMFRRAGGSTVGHLRVGDVRALPIPVAPREVQLRLTSTLRSLDEALHRNEKTLSRLEDCKSALMSDVLTGRKRVTDALPMAAE